MALSENKIVTVGEGIVHELPMLASATIYEGGFVGESSGYARALVAGDKFLGLCTKKAIETTGANGGKSVRVRRDALVKYAVTGAASQADVGKKVYASADDTLTLVRGSNSLAGWIVAWISSTTCWVQLFVDMERLPLDGIPKYKVTVTTDSTAGALAMTAAMWLGGMILRDPNGAGRADTTPTPAALAAAIKDVQVGDAIEFTIRNTADAAETITVTASGVDVTISGTATIAQNNSKRFLAVFTNVTSGTEAYTLYSLGTVVH